MKQSSSQAKPDGKETDLHPVHAQSSVWDDGFRDGKSGTSYEGNPEYSLTQQQEYNDGYTHGRLRRLIGVVSKKHGQKPQTKKKSV
jgi:hypothetical protein